MFLTVVPSHSECVSHTQSTKADFCFKYRWHPKYNMCALSRSQYIWLARICVEEGGRGSWWCWLLCLPRSPTRSLLYRYVVWNGKLSCYIQLWLFTIMCLETLNLFMRIVYDCHMQSMPLIYRNSFQFHLILSFGAYLFSFLFRLRLSVCVWYVVHAMPSQRQCQSIQ